MFRFKLCILFSEVNCAVSFDFGGLSDAHDFTADFELFIFQLFYFTRLRLSVLKCHGREFGVVN